MYFSHENSCFFYFTFWIIYCRFHTISAKTQSSWACFYPFGTKEWASRSLHGQTDWLSTHHFQKLEPGTSPSLLHRRQTKITLTWLITHYSAKKYILVNHLLASASWLGSVMYSSITGVDCTKPLFLKYSSKAIYASIDFS